MLEEKKVWSERNTNIGCMAQEYLKKNYYNYLNIFTDGSKQSEQVGVRIYIPEFNKGINTRISNRLSIYAAELVAVFISLQWVEEVK